MELSPKARLMRDWLLSEWTEHLSQILESMADVRPTVDRTPSSDGQDAPAPGSFIWRQSFAISPEPSLWIATTPSNCLEFGARTLKAAGIASTDEADAQNTFVEILVQSLSALGQSIGGHLGVPAAASDGEQLSMLPPQTDWISVRLQCEDSALSPFWLSFSIALLDRLASGPLATVEQPIHPEAAPELNSGTAELPAFASKTFDVLLDVSLPVSISFGRTFLPIKDVLKLISGSIVELDRGVNEPVEIIVNNCVIARGEVVVIEGNYGVRIQQIASRYDRLRTGTSATQIQSGSPGKPQ